ATLITARDSHPCCKTSSRSGSRGAEGDKDGKSGRDHCAGSVIGSASEAGDRANQIQRIGSPAPAATRGGLGPGSVGRRLIRIVRGLSRPGRSGAAAGESAGAILPGSPVAARAADARTRPRNGGANTGGTFAATRFHFRSLAGRASLRIGWAGQRWLLRSCVRWGRQLLFHSGGRLRAKGRPGES